MRLKFYFIFFYILPLFSFGQKTHIDSIESLLKVSKEDTSKVDLLNNAAVYYLNVNSQKSIYYSIESQKLAVSLNDKQGVARALNNIGMAYENMGKYDEAMQKYLESLRIKEEINYVSGIGPTLNNIGLIYDIEGSVDKALEYYKKAYDFAVRAKDDECRSNTLLNIGVVYMEKNKNDEALDYFKKALELSVKSGNKKCQLNAINNIGLQYSSKGQPDSALMQYSKGIEIARETGDSLNIASSYNNTAVILFEKKDLKSAIIAMNNAVRAAKSIDAQPNLINYYENLAEIYDTLRDYKQAYTYHKLYSDLKDTLQNADKLKRIAELQFAYDTEKKEKEASVIENQKELKREAEAGRQKMLIICLVAGVIIITLFLLFLYNRFVLVNKQKKIIEEKNDLVELKNKEITDSIHYAKRIQRALLAGDKLLKEQLPEHFVLYKPKDIVSGDFYWAAAQSGRFYFCVADCTGHGVPGAFMSLLNISFLNESLIQKKIESPDKILDDVRQQIVLSLNPEGTEESKDGMDAILCMFDLKGMWLRFACANNPLWLIRNNELKVFDADKMPVGKHHGEIKSFTLQTIGLRKGDIVYMITDGYADQFGGDKGKKFKYKNLQDLLISISMKTMAEQQEILSETIEKWRGSLEQVDDILIAGIRF